MLGQSLPQPENGWRRYNDNYTRLHYVGSWAYGANTSYYQGDRTLSNKIDDYVKITFTGSNIRIISAIGAIGTETTNSSQIDVKIDNNPIESFSIVSTTSSATLFQVVVYEKLNLPQGIHTITIKNKQNLNFTLDAIDIDSNGELLRHDYFETDYEEPMRKYGIAWYDFDESSGNTIDKLGSGYVGTITGATRVSGWNGEGNALDFDGIDDVLVQTLGSSADIPSTGGLTMRFKFKCNTNKSTDMYMVASLNAFTTQKGMTIYINNGKIGTAWSNSGGNFCYYIVSENTYIDNKWHDLFLSWDGLKDSLVYLFIDDMTKPIAKVKANFNNNGHLYPNFNIGRLAGVTNGWFTGQIDDFQLYDKALSPSDFTQKRLVVKTSDNKNLVLSPTSTRVKEIPNTEEYMILAQGGIVREIDSAVDRPPIDFTKTTTEYEIVTNNKSALGKGRMFTIPIGSYFKTAMIEDNY
ncbi:LamG-like jellyroll fold domain-containing protein [Lysinibacillus sp. NPDC086135]|uniref:LamG-like jellyroll fold domain-containing protein n=1 Tax=Lysinibacillus sp. NPDC086135 TaxID=3364130 RepID=UPI0037F1311A